uniref:Uncharacterized protein n=1 Tax=Ascaris lumbricoides TaxID=6252 RepID=A0A0M3HYI1_ASCLU
MMIRSEIFIYLLTSTICLFADDNATVLLFDAEMVIACFNYLFSTITLLEKLVLSIGNMVDVQTNLSHLSIDHPKGVINETLVKIDDTNSPSNIDNKDDKKVKLEEKNPKLLKHSQAIAKKESLKEYKKNGSSYVNTTMTNNVRKSSNNNSSNGRLSERQAETNNGNATTNLKKSIKGKDIPAKMESMYKMKEKGTEMKIKESKKRENKQEAITRRLRMLRMFLFK